MAKGRWRPPCRLHRDPAGPEGDAGRRLDTLIAHTVGGVGKAVKWNSPL
jgi:hypothetical protein